MIRKYFNFVLFSAFITIFFVFFSSCDDGPTEPNVEPGRRDYTWTRDTLKIEEFEFDMLSMRAIWGATPDDVWVGGSAQSYKYVLWHYNGIKWSKHLLDKSISIGGFYGIDRNNIWATTSLNSIWHYNGGGWTESSNFSYPGYDGVALDAIDGLSNNKIIAVGSANNYYHDNRTRIIMKFDGSSWNFVNIPKENEIFSNVMIDNFTKKIFIDGDRISNPQLPSYKYILEDDSLIEILSSRNVISLGKINGKVYHVDGKKIYDYNDGKLNLIHDFTNTNFAGRIWGRSEKDFFCLTWDFTIAHFNGTDLATVYPITYDIYIADALIFEKDVFFICSEFGTGINFVVHGKLN